MSLLIHGGNAGILGLVAAMRVVATARGTRPFRGHPLELVQAFASVALAAQHAQERDIIDDLGPLLALDEPWSSEEEAVAAIARWIPDHEQRGEVVHAALLVALDADQPDPHGLHAARWLARGLGADDATVRDVEATCRSDAARAQTDLFRRFLSWKTGLTVEVIAARMDHLEPPVLTPAADLELLRRAIREPKDGTVADQLARFYADTEFDLPGSPGVLPLEVLGSHDIHHVLTAYDASPEDEVYLAVFNAANSQKGGMDYLAVIMLQWHQGIRVGVFDPDRARLDPRKLAAAALRGSETTTDLSARSWDFWSILDIPLDDARTTLGIPPGGSVLPGGHWDAGSHRIVPVRSATGEAT